MLFDGERTLFYPKKMPNAGIEKLMSVYGIHFGFFGTLETIETVRSIKTRSGVGARPYIKVTFKDVSGRNYINGLIFADETQVEAPDADEIVWVMGYYNPKFRTLNVRVIMSVTWFPEYPEGMSYWEVLARNLDQGLSADQGDPEHDQTDDDTSGQIGDGESKNVIRFARNGDIHGS